MNCTACGTRLGSSERNCPNCGRGRKAQTSSGSTASNDSSGTTLAPSSAKIPSMGQGLRKPDAPKAQPKAAKRAGAKPAPVEPEIEEIEPHELVEESGGLGNEGICGLIQDQPDRIEEGLSIYTDAKAEPVGIDYSCDVGLIDLLGVDDAGGLVAVMVPGRDDSGDMPAAKDLVSGALERVGWIRKHLAESGQEVRAVVLLDAPIEDLSYTAAAVAQTVSFKIYRLELRISPLEV
jgi:hypothetical protein